ncbi:MAG TPA: FtsQ-type POTRA domain-containing protein [Micromonosporaceae bacterium]
MTGRRGDTSGPRAWRLVRARTDAVPASVRRFNQRARRRRIRAAAPWLSAAVVVAIGAVAGWLVLNTSLLGVDRITVEGAHLVSADQVRQAAAVPLGTPLARVDADAVRRRLVAALPPVRSAHVRRGWPSTLVVQVIERTPVAVVPHGRGFLLVDADGVGYLAVPSRPGGLPLVRVAHPAPDDATTRAALTVLGALTPKLRDGLGALVADAPTRIRLEMADGRVVVWGDATENAAKARVATSLLARPGTTIDVSAPDVVTVR